MPKNEHTPNPVAESGVQCENAFTAVDDTPFVQVRRVEVALLRGLFCHSAALVKETADSLEPEDFLFDAHQRIMRAVTEAAHSLIEGGEGARKVCPEVVGTKLQNSGELFHGGTHAALVEAITGHPPAWQDVQTLAAGLRINRLRRTVEDLGHCFLSAATDSTETLVATLNQINRLQTIQRRAGLEVS